jgi:hypothetical protein
MPADAFNEDGSRQKRDTPTSDLIGLKEEGFCQAERWVCDNPVEGVGLVGPPKEVFGFADAIIKNIA